MVHTQKNTVASAEVFALVFTSLGLGVALIGLAAQLTEPPEGEIWQWLSSHADLILTGGLVLTAVGLIGLFSVSVTYFLRGNRGRRGQEPLLVRWLKSFSRVVNLLARVRPRLPFYLMSTRGEIEERSALREKDDWEVRELEAIDKTLLEVERLVENFREIPEGALPPDGAWGGFYESRLEFLLGDDFPLPRKTRQEYRAALGRLQKRFTACAAKPRHEDAIAVLEATMGRDQSRSEKILHDRSARLSRLVAGLDH